MSPQRPFPRRIVPLVALFLAVGHCAIKVGAQVTQRPYSKEAIVGLLKGEVSPKRVAVLARQRGIDFQVTPEVESELRRAGATDSLVATLRDLSPAPPKPPEKPTEIIVQTSPGAEVYLDDRSAGRASAKGQLVIANLKTGNHSLRVSLAGKQGFEQNVAVAMGQVTEITAALEDLPGTVLVQTLPGATVFLDGSSHGTTDASGQLSVPKVTAGSHDLRITATGKKDYQETIAVPSAQPVRVEAALADLAGSMTVHTSPGAAVFLDDSRLGTTDASGYLATQPVAAGVHELRIAAPGKRDYRHSITVPAGREAKIDARLADLGPPPGTVRENSKDGLKYVLIPPGAFMMGCSPGDSECGAEEKPAHRVAITKGFWMGRTEVTVGAYKRFAGGTGRQMPPDLNFFDRKLIKPGWGEDAMPIEEVKWEDAQAYCAWTGGRLPTEAEWEYAARAGSTATRYGNLDEIAWYAFNSGRQHLDATTIANEIQANQWANYRKRLKENGNNMHEVGQKSANGFGLYDVLGNVAEWVNDWYDQNYYKNSPSQDPPGPASGQARVLRGGSWYVDPRLVRVSHRVSREPAAAYDYGGVGFRCGGDALAP